MIAAREPINQGVNCASLEAAGRLARVEHDGE
jgi:hypothetical protein